MTQTGLDDLDPRIAAAVQGEMLQRAEERVPDDDGVVDFTKKSSSKKFRIDGDVFEATRAIPAGTALEFVDMANTWNRGTAEEAKTLLMGMFALVLLEESHERFSARITDKNNPIDIEQVGDVIVWLLEQYGFRPTPPSPDSSNGSSSLGDGTSSTEDPLAGVSTSAPSASTDS